MNALKLQSHGHGHNGYHMLSSSPGSLEGIDIESSTKEAEPSHQEDNRNTSRSEKSSLSKNLHILILANLLIFILSVVLFASIPYRSSNQLNEALKQVSSYCMATRSSHTML